MSNLEESSLFSDESLQFGRNLALGVGIGAVVLSKFVGVPTEGIIVIGASEGIAAGVFEIVRQLVARSVTKG